MKLFPVVVRRFTTIISGIVNWLARTKPAIRLAATGRLLVPEKPATKLQATGQLLVGQKPAPRLTPIVIGTAFAPPIDPATKLQATGRLLMGEKPAASLDPVGLLKVPEKPAVNVVRVDIDLAHSSHVVTGSNDLGATEEWDTPSNVQGAPQGNTSLFQGQALLLAAGVLRGTHVAQPNRPASLVIDEVWLDFYGLVQGLPIVSDLVSRLNLRYRVNTSPAPGAETTLQSITTGASNFLATPLSFRINRTGVDSGKFTDGATALLSTDVTWANIALIQSNWDAAVILGLIAAIYRADAVRLRVIAHEDWLL